MASTRDGLSWHHLLDKCIMMIRRLAATKIPSPGVAVLTGFATQTKPVRFESAGASAVGTFNFGVNPDDATEAQ